MRTLQFGPEALIQTFPSFIYLFPDQSLYVKSKFLYTGVADGNPFIVRNVDLACSSASGMQHSFTRSALMFKFLGLLLNLSDNYTKLYE